MTLEDRIHTTGEHYLGSFDPAPDLADRIERRVVVRMRRRRQRAAAGLGVGAVVVMGGLVVANTERPGPTAPVAGPTQVTPALVTLAGDDPPTTTVALGTTAAPVTTPPTIASTTTQFAVAVTDTVVAPMGADAPPLFLAAESGTVRVELRDGTVAAEPTATVGGWAEPASAAAAGYVLDTAADGTRRDRCGQFPLTVSGVDRASGSVAVPEFAFDLWLSADGTRGVIRSTVCPEPGTYADGPVGSVPAAGYVTFTPGDPAAAPVAVELPAPPAELSSDGRFALVEHDAGVEVVDLITGEVFPALPADCTALGTDPGTGYLVGADGIAALARCGGDVALVAGRVGAAEIRETFDGCGDTAALAVRSGDLDPASNWYAVFDPSLHRAWVVGPDGMGILDQPVTAVGWYAAGV